MTTLKVEGKEKKLMLKEKKPPWGTKFKRPASSTHPSPSFGPSWPESNTHQSTVTGRKSWQKPLIFSCKTLRLGLKLRLPKFELHCNFAKQMSGEWDLNLGPQGFQVTQSLYKINFFNSSYICKWEQRLSTDTKKMSRTVQRNTRYYDGCLVELCNQHYYNYYCCCRRLIIIILYNIKMQSQ